MCNVPVAWRSKAQKSVTLSSSEAEFVSLSEAAKEVKFIVQDVESMEIKVKKPVTVRVDNIGAIYMAKDSKHHSVPSTLMCVTSMSQNLSTKDFVRSFLSRQRTIIAMGLQRIWGESCMKNTPRIS